MAQAGVLNRASAFCLCLVVSVVVVALVITTWKVFKARNSYNLYNHHNIYNLKQNYPLTIPLLCLLLQP